METNGSQSFLQLMHCRAEGFNFYVQIFFTAPRKLSIRVPENVMAWLDY